MYNWNQFRNLPRVKDLPRHEQARQYWMYEAQNSTSVAAASSAAGAGGSSDRLVVSPTNGKAQIILYTEDGVWKYFIGDSSGNISDVFVTDISSEDWSTYVNGIAESKGFSILFTGSGYKLLSIKSDGTIVNTLNTDSYDTYEQYMDGKGFLYLYNDGSTEYYNFFDGEKVTAGSFTYSSGYDFYGSNSDYTSTDGFFISAYNSDLGDYLLNFVDFVEGDIIPWGYTNGSISYNTFASLSCIYEAVNGGGYWPTLNIRDKNKNLLQTLDVSYEYYYNWDMYSYGTGKFAMIFFNPDNVNYATIVSYDESTDTLLTKQHDMSINHWFNAIYSSNYPSSIHDKFNEQFGLFFYNYSYNIDPTGNFVFYNATYSNLVTIIDGATAIGDPVYFSGGVIGWGWGLQPVGGYFSTLTAQGTWDNITYVNLSIIDNNNSLIYGATISGYATASVNAGTNTYWLKDKGVNVVGIDGLNTILVTKNDGSVVRSTFSSNDYNMSNRANALVVLDYIESKTYYLGSSNTLVELSDWYPNYYYSVPDTPTNQDSSVIWLYNQGIKMALLKDSSIAWTADFSYIDGYDWLNKRVNPHFVTILYRINGVNYIRKYNTNTGDMVEKRVKSGYNYDDYIYEGNMVVYKYYSLSEDKNSYYFITENSIKHFEITSSNNDWTYNDWYWFND